MAETDDIVALIDGTRIHVAKLSLGCCTCGVKTFQPGWHDANCPVRSVAEALDNLDSIATALTEQAAQVERLTRERDEAIREMSGWAAKAGEIEGRLKASEWPGVVEGWKDRATTAERERDEARAEVERLRELFRSDGEQHAQFVKNLTKAHEDRITKYADAFNEIRAEVERKDASLRLAYGTLAQAFGRIHGLPRTSDTDLANAIGQTRAKIEAALRPNGGDDVEG